VTPHVTTMDRGELFCIAQSRIAQAIGWTRLRT
jgi:hypothetical protein